MKKDRHKQVPSMPLDIADGKEGRLKLEESIRAVEFMVKPQTEDSKNAIFKRIVALRFESEKDLLTKECGIVDSILLELVTQVEKSLRMNLADRLSVLSEAPAALLDFLVHDAIEVASPILTTYQDLPDDLMVSVIEANEFEHQSIIAARSDLSEAVYQSLIAHGNEDVLLILAGNDEVKLADQSLWSLVRKSEKMRSLSKPLLERDDLPPDCAHFMFWWVSSVLRHHILENFIIDQHVLDAAISQAEKASLNQPEMMQMMDRLRSTTEGSEWLGVNDLIARLRADDLPGFVRSVSDHLGIAVQTAKRAIGDHTGEPMAMICRALDADRGQFTTMILLIDYKKFGKARPMGHVENASAIYDMTTPEVAGQTIRLWSLHDQMRIAA